MDPRRPTIELAWSPAVESAARGKAVTPRCHRALVPPSFQLWVPETAPRRIISFRIPAPWQQATLRQAASVLPNQRSCLAARLAGCAALSPTPSPFGTRYYPWAVRPSRDRRAPVTSVLPAPFDPLFRWASE